MSIELRPIATLNQHNVALLFSQYLNSIEIFATVEKLDGQYAILCREADLERAHIEFKQFIEQPNHPRYQAAAWNASETVHVEQHTPSIASEFKAHFLAHAGLVTLTVFITCWALWLIGLFGWQREIFATIRFFPQLTYEWLAAEPWRLVGPAFFHFSWLHIVFNTMWWWQLGGAIENVMGKRTLLSLFFASAILSNLAQYMVTGANFGGLSGVVYAVVGYVWWAGWLAPQVGLSLSKPIVGFLLFWLLLGFVNVLPVNVANAAHLLGLVSGCFLAWMDFGGDRSTPKPKS